MISSQTPEEAGLGVFANWTAALACAFVEQKFGISFSSRGMLNLFDRLGLSYTRPTYTLEKADPQKQEQFLKNVLSQYPNGKIVIILDNAKIHHAKLLKGFLEENKNSAELVYLPPYSPNLNKIEELWGWLKIP